MFRFGFICLFASCRRRRREEKDSNDAAHIDLCQSQSEGPGDGNPISLQTERSRNEITKPPTLLIGQRPASGCEDKGCFSPMLLGASLMDGSIFGGMLPGTWMQGCDLQAFLIQTNTQL